MVAVVVDAVAARKAADLVERDHAAVGVGRSAAQVDADAVGVGDRVRLDHGRGPVNVDPVAVGVRDGVAGHDRVVAVVHVDARGIRVEDLVAGDGRAILVVEVDAIGVGVVDLVALRSLEVVAAGRTEVSALHGLLAIRM